jgi:hypothetical protein
MLNETLNKIDGGFFSPKRAQALPRSVQLAGELRGSLPAAGRLRRLCRHPGARRPAVSAPLPSGNARPFSTSLAWARSRPTAPFVTTPSTPGTWVHFSRKPDMLSKKEVVSLCRGEHGDPFSVLGLHTDAKGRLWLRSLQPGAIAVSAIDPNSGQVIVELTQRKIDVLGESSGFFEASILGGNRFFDYRLRIEWPGGVQEVTTPTASRRCSANSTSGCSPKARIFAPSSGSARTCAKSTASRAPPSLSGRPMPSASASSATSTPGTAGAIRCACAANVVSGKSSSRALRKALATSTRFVRARATSSRSRPTPTASPPSCGHRRPPSSVRCRRLQRAPAYPPTSVSGRRSRSTKCIWARGAATKKAASSTGSASPRH